MAIDNPQQQPPLRAVLDTSVLVPARLREDLQSLVQDGAFTAIWSPWIIAELYRVLTWRWLAQIEAGQFIRNLQDSQASPCEVEGFVCAATAAVRQSYLQL